jgi:predicted dehydrogenase
MSLDIRGQLSTGRRVRAGVIGCGSHAFRNVFPTFQFAPIDLIATCDLNQAKAEAFARQFGAQRAYSDHHRLLADPEIEAVFIVTNYVERGRPRYPAIATDCLRAGKHVWMEKPPAASSEEIRSLQSLQGDLKVMAGFKKMFFPANEKARQLMSAESFGQASLITLQYPQHVPGVEDLKRYVHDREKVDSVTRFLDHVCHPVSLLIMLAGMPAALFYQRSADGCGLATFTYSDGTIASLALTHRAAYAGGAERTTIVSEHGGHIIVDNNLRVSLHRDDPAIGYGSSPSYYVAPPDRATVVWEPEFSLGQLYNKGLFLLGYWGEVNEFAGAILDGRPVAKCHLEHAWQITRIFEAFAEGPGRVIPLQ